MRHEIQCALCQPHVLVVQTPEPAPVGALDRELRKRGWEPYGPGGVCPECVPKLRVQPAGRMGDDPNAPGLLGPTVDEQETK